MTRYFLFSTHWRLSLVKTFHFFPFLPFVVGRTSLSICCSPKPHLLVLKYGHVVRLTTLEPRETLAIIASFHLFSFPPFSEVILKGNKQQWIYFLFQMFSGNFDDTFLYQTPNQMLRALGDINFSRRQPAV